jgi:selenocysteine-specific elongation factor
MTTPAKSVVIGTAGHIDHGKTALIRALTGIDADRLPEEKRRGITIDLGFAFLDTASSDGAPLRISFVDVPGHSLFIHNMLAGTGCIGAVLLVISAQEGVKPQTVEHMAICRLLGVRFGLTVITKMDAVEPARLAQVRLEVKQFLRGTFLDPDHAEVLAVSALSGQNIEELRQKLVRLVEDTNQSDFDHLPRLPIDRAFVMKGFGTIVTGTLLSGSLHTGQSLVVEPGGRTVRVRGIQTHSQANDVVQSGSRVALNLSGIEVSEVGRGQTLVAPETLPAVSTIDVEAWLLPDSSGVKHGGRVHFHAFTSNTMASVLLYDRPRFEPGSARLMRMKLQTPIVLVPGDRFVLRQVSPAATIGGGTVLDAHPLPRLRKPLAMAWLDSLRTASAEEQLLLRVARRSTRGLSIQRLMVETGLSREAAERLLQPGISVDRLFRTPSGLLVASPALDAVSEAISSQLRQHASGLKRSELRTRTSISPEILDFSLEHLARAGKLRLKGELVCPPEDGRVGPAVEDPTLTAIAAIYLKAGLAAPSQAEVAVMLKLKESDLRAPFTLLLREKVLVRMGSETLFIHQEALDRLRSEIKELRGQMVDVARFKQITGLSRKYAIPLLEYLDRERITRKVGDQRLVL